MFHQPVKNGIPVLCIGNNTFTESLAVPVTELVKTYRAGDAFQFAAADTVFKGIHFLIGDAAFLEETFGFLCVKALAAKDLKTHKNHLGRMLKRIPRVCQEGNKMKQTVLVTGASGGIGSAVVRRLAMDGYTVLAHANRGMAAAESLSRRLCAEGLDVHPVQADLSDCASVSRMTSGILELYHELYGIVHCAGIACTGLLMDMSDAAWDQVISTNLSSAFYLCRAFLPGMVRRQSGSIVLISSMWGRAGASCEAAYSASKAGLIGLTRALAKEMGPSGIRVNCVAPGVIDTPMMEGYSEADRAELAETAALGRIGKPEDVAGICAFLLGRESAFITGETIGVDGGFL